MEGDLNPLDRKDLGVEGTSSGNNVRHLVTKCSFSHNITDASKQKTYLTNFFKEYALMKEMPLNMESFCHKMLILSQF